MNKRLKEKTRTLHRRRKKAYRGINNINYTKLALAVDSFINMHTMSKNDFLKKVFDAAFGLIAEAEKGSFYELVGDEYIPIFGKGYDLELLKKIVFRREDAFRDYKCSETANIDAYEVHIEKRDDTQFSEEIISVFKKLGTYSNFTCLYAPIQVNGINVGIICFDCFNKSDYSRTSKEVLKFYAQIISNFYTQIILREKEKKMYDDIVTALVSVIEVKDKYTEGHARRVREYSCAIAKELNMSKIQIEELSTAALLHDIGKIGIPTEILQKPSKLTEDEYDIIKKHTIYTKTILEKITNFSNVTDYAYNHHERYDGTGYPRGLKNDEIPFEAQIIQLADAYDAMTSERAYRRACSSQKALEVIEEQMGKQFNPRIAQAAIKILSNE